MTWSGRMIYTVREEEMEPAQKQSSKTAKTDPEQ